VRVNCEQNSLLYLVRPRGVGACHTKDASGKARRTCYYRRLVDGQLEFVEEKA
jgi:phosphoribosyl-AMP cyclohydrolase